MPVYEFQCRVCQVRVEEYHPISRAPDLGKPAATSCPQCGGACIRILSDNRGVLCASAKLANDAKYPYSTHRWAGLKGITHQDADGFDVIESPEHERRVAALNGLKRE